MDPYSLEYGGNFSNTSFKYFFRADSRDTGTQSTRSSGLQTATQNGHTQIFQRMLSKGADLAIMPSDNLIKTFVF